MSDLSYFFAITLKEIVEREQEALNLQEIANYRGLGFTQQKKEETIEVTLELRK